MRVGVPTGGAERKELGRVGQVHDAVGRGAMGFAQQAMTQVLARHQHPIGSELANFARQPMHARGRFVDGNDLDGRVMGKLGPRLGRTGHDAARMAGVRQVIEPDQVAARGAAAGR